jgi:hypothetical protein
MEFDRPLGVGAVGGHGPIRYWVEGCVPGESVRFHLTGPPGFNGYHGFEISTLANGDVLLRHTLAMTTHGRALLTWPLIFRPLHDALLEDSLATAEVSLQLPSHVRPWSCWVRLLRWSFSRGRAPHQRAFANTRPIPETVLR